MVVVLQPFWEYSDAAPTHGSGELKRLICLSSGKLFLPVHCRGPKGSRHGLSLGFRPGTFPSGTGTDTQTINSTDYEIFQTTKPRVRAAIRQPR